MVQAESSQAELWAEVVALREAIGAIDARLTLFNSLVGATRALAAVVVTDGHTAVDTEALRDAGHLLRDLTE